MSKRLRRITRREFGTTLAAAGVFAAAPAILRGRNLNDKLNIAFIGGFNGQTVGSMGLTSSLPTAFPAGQSLTANSTVQQVLDYANYLIANAKLNNGVTITQTQIGQLNTFLGLINSEA